jgi:hypothetical protein
VDTQPQGIVRRIHEIENLQDYTITYNSTNSALANHYYDQYNPHQKRDNPFKAKPLYYHLVNILQ